MFGRRDDDNDGGATPPPTMPGPEEQFLALVPPTKTLKVIRHALPSTELQEPLETLFIEAHAIGVSDDNRTVFQVWRFNGLAGPHLEVVRLLTGVVDVSEVSVPPQPSRLTIV